MMVIMKSGHTQPEIDAILARLDEVGLKGHPIEGVERTVIAVLGCATATVFEHVALAAPLRAHLDRAVALLQSNAKCERLECHLSSPPIGRGSVFVAWPPEIELESFPGIL